MASQTLCFKDSLGFTTTPERSKLMARIKGLNTKPEIKLRKELWRLGIRYRVNYKKLPGSPDVVILKRKLAIFVDGEFWHGYNWELKKSKLKANRNYWIPKIERNMQRDLENNLKLVGLGFIVLRFWEHEIYHDLKKCINTIMINNK